jgi:hypothetical protein
MSLESPLSPAEATEPQSRARDRVDAYGRLFGWPVRWRGSQPFLALANGICAVTMPKPGSGPALSRLAATGCGGPTLRLLTAHGQQVAVLADLDTLLPPAEDLPRNVAVLAWGALLPLPVAARRSASQRADVIAEWLTPPDPHRRWLPSLDAVLAGIANTDR